MVLSEYRSGRLEQRQSLISAALLYPTRTRRLIKQIEIFTDLASNIAGTALVSGTANNSKQSYDIK